MYWWHLYDFRAEICTVIFGWNSWFTIHKKWCLRVYYIRGSYELLCSGNASRLPSKNATKRGGNTFLVCFWSTTLLCSTELARWMNALKRPHTTIFRTWHKGLMEVHFHKLKVFSTRHCQTSCYEPARCIEMSFAPSLYNISL